MFPTTSSGLLDSHSLQQQQQQQLDTSGRPLPPDTPPSLGITVRRYPTSGGTVVMSHPVSRLPVTSVPKFVPSPNDVQSTSGAGADLVSGFSGGRLVGIGGHKNNGMLTAGRQTGDAMLRLVAGTPRQHADADFSGRRHLYHQQDRPEISNATASSADEVVNLRMSKTTGHARASPTDRAQVLDLRSVHGTLNADQPLDLTGGSIARKRCLQSGDNEDGAELETSTTRDCLPIDLSVKRPKTQSSTSGPVQPPLSASARRLGVVSGPYRTSVQQTPQPNAFIAGGSGGGIQVASCPLVQLQQPGTGARLESLQYGTGQPPPESVAYQRFGHALSNGHQHVPVIHRSLPTSRPEASAPSASGKSTLRQQSHGPTSAIGHERHRVGVLSTSSSSSAAAAATAASTSFQNAAMNNISLDVNSFRKSVAVKAMRNIVPDHRGHRAVGAPKVSSQQLYHNALQQKLLPKSGTPGDASLTNDKRQQRPVATLLHHSGNGVLSSTVSSQPVLQTAGGRVIQSAIGFDLCMRELNDPPAHYVTPPPPPLIRQPGTPVHQLPPMKRPVHVGRSCRVRAPSWSLPVGLDSTSNTLNRDVLPLAGRFTNSSVTSGEADGADGLYFRNMASASVDQHLQRDASIVGEVVHQASPIVGSGGFLLDRSKIFQATIGGSGSDISAGGLLTSYQSDIGNMSTSGVVAVVDKCNDIRPSLTQSSSTLAKSYGRGYDDLTEGESIAAVSVSHRVDGSNEHHHRFNNSSQLTDVVLTASLRPEMTVTGIQYPQPPNDEILLFGNAKVHGPPSSGSSIVMQRDLPLSVISRAFDRIDGTSMTSGGSLNTSPGSRRGIPIANVHPIMKDSSSSLSVLSNPQQVPLPPKSTSVASAEDFSCPEKRDNGPNGPMTSVKMANDVATPLGGFDGNLIIDTKTDKSKTTVVADLTRAADGMSSSIKDIPDIPLVLGGQGSPNALSIVGAGASGRHTGSTPLSSHHMEYVKFLQQTTVPPVENVRQRGGSKHLGVMRGGGRHQLNQKQHQTPPASVLLADGKTSDSVRGGRSSVSSIARKPRGAKTANCERRSVVARRQLMMTIDSNNADNLDTGSRPLKNEAQSDVKISVSASTDRRFSADDTAVENTMTSHSQLFESTPITDLKLALDGSFPTMTSSSSVSSASSTTSHKKTPIVYFDEDETSSMTENDSTAADADKTGSDISECKTSSADEVAVKRTKNNRNKIDSQETKTKSRMTKRCQDDDKQQQQQKDHPRRAKTMGANTAKKLKLCAGEDQSCEIDVIKDDGESCERGDGKTASSEPSISRKPAMSDKKKSESSNISPLVDSGRGRGRRTVAASAAAAATAGPVAASDGGSKKRRRTNIDLLIGESNLTAVSEHGVENVEEDGFQSLTGIASQTPGESLSPGLTTRYRRERLRPGVAARGRGGRSRLLSGTRHYEQQGCGIHGVRAEWPASEALSQHDPSFVIDDMRAVGSRDDGDVTVDEKPSLGRPRTTPSGRHKNQYPDVFSRRRMRGATSVRRRPRRRYSFISGGESTSFGSCRAEVETGRWDTTSRVPLDESSESSLFIDHINGGTRLSTSNPSSSWSLSSAVDSSSAATSSMPNDPYGWSTDTLPLPCSSSTAIKATPKYLRGGVARGRSACRRRGLTQSGCRRRLEATSVIQRRGKHVTKRCRQFPVESLMSYDCVEDQPCGDTRPVGQTSQPAAGGDELLSSATVDEESTGETVLHKASRYDYQELVLYLLKSGMISANVQDNVGRTPLHISCAKGHLTVTRLLLAYGALPNCKTVQGNRPIHCAVLNGHLHIVRELLLCGADVTLPDGDGRTVQQLATRWPMRHFVRGVIGDLGCGGGKLHEMPWEFPSPFDCHDCDVLNGAPPSDDEAADVTFDVGIDPLLPVYRLQPDWNKRARNYHRLGDVTSITAQPIDPLTGDDRKTIPENDCVLFTTETIEHQLRPPVWNRSSASQLVSTDVVGMSVPLVELSESVKRLTFIETTFLDASPLSRRSTDRGQPTSAIKVELGIDCPTCPVSGYVTSVKMEHLSSTSPSVSPSTATDAKDEASQRRSSAIDCSGLLDDCGANITGDRRDVEINPPGQPHRDADVHQPISLQSAVSQKIASGTAQLGAEIACDTSLSSASDTMLLLPVLEKHDVPTTSTGELVVECRSVAGFHQTPTVNGTVRQRIDLELDAENRDDITLSSRPEVSAVDRKSACFNEDDDDREMPELTLYA